MSNEKAEKKVLVDGQEPIEEAPKDETKEQANKWIFFDFGTAVNGYD